MGALRLGRVRDQHLCLVVVADGENLGGDPDADGVAFTEIVIDDDAHDVPPFRGETAP
jgi:hypothetical protein